MLLCAMVHIGVRRVTLLSQSGMLCYSVLHGVTLWLHSGMHTAQVIECFSIAFASIQGEATLGLLFEILFFFCGLYFGYI